MTPEESSEASKAMWLRLAQQLSDAIPDLVISGRIDRALEYGMSADVCFWYSTGEGDAFSMREAIAALKATSKTS